MEGFGLELGGGSKIDIGAYINIMVELGSTTTNARIVVSNEA